MKHIQSLMLATIVGVAAALLFTACQNAETAQTPTPATQPVSAAASAAARMATPPLIGTRWVLETILGTEITVAALPELQLVDGENRVMGSTSVNRFNGVYKLDGETVGFEKLITTRMAGDEASMRLENAYVKMLEAVNKWEIRDGELKLFTGPLQVASFKAKQ